MTNKFVFLIFQGFLEKNSALNCVRMVMCDLKLMSHTHFIEPVVSQHSTFLLHLEGQSRAIILFICSINGSIVCGEYAASALYETLCTIMLQAPISSIDNVHSRYIYIAGVAISGILGGFLRGGVLRF